MSRYLNAVSQGAFTVRAQRWTIGALAAVACVAIGYAHFKDTQFTAYIPPDLSQGATLKIGGTPEVPAPYVYTFAFHLWQMVNNWPSDGAEDYSKQIAALKYYFTPACRSQLEEDLRIKGGNGELKKRTRAIMEIPGAVFSADRVTAHGDGSWTVLLDTQLMETSLGVPVKQAFIRYPLRVVRYDVSRDNNPFQLAIDCFGDRRPERLLSSDVPVAPMPASAAATPAILPQPVAPIPTAPAASNASTQPAAVAQSAPLAPPASPAQPSQP